MANPDVVAQYRAVCDRMAAIASGCDPDVTVPACPDWTVRDLFAHVASVANSWVHHDLEHYGSQPWAQAGVDRLAGLGRSRRRGVGIFPTSERLRSLGYVD